MEISIPITSKEQQAGIDQAIAERSRLCREVLKDRELKKKKETDTKDEKRRRKK